MNCFFNRFKYILFFFLLCFALPASFFARAVSLEENQPRPQKHLYKASSKEEANPHSLPGRIMEKASRKISEEIQKRLPNQNAERTGGSEEPKKANEKESGNREPEQKGGGESGNRGSQRSEERENGNGEEELKRNGERESEGVKPEQNNEKETSGQDKNGPGEHKSDEDKNGNADGDEDSENEESLAAQEACTVELAVNGVISASTLDVLDRAIEKVKKTGCVSLLLLINTPGGILQTTRKIVDRILNTPFPVLCFITPAGAQAASAGAIIMQACHVNGGLRSTNLGAATPVVGQGKDMPKDMRNKVINDTTAWVEGLTKLRGRSQKFGREIITEAKSLSAEDALKEKGIDFVGSTKEEFLEFAVGREVLVEHEQKHRVRVGKIIPYELGFRHKVNSILTSPDLLYIMFMGSLLLIYFEITHPGFGAPGILGIVGLILSFVGMDMLNFSLGGLALLLLSFILFLVEVFLAGYGIFGIMGIVSFILGSFLLFDPAQTGGVDISVQLILTASSVFFLLIGLLSYLTIKTLRLKKNTIGEQFIDGESLPGFITKLEEEGGVGYLTYKGESWKFKPEDSLEHAFQVGEKVEVVRQKGMVMYVKPLRQKESK